MDGGRWLRFSSDDRAHGEPPSEEQALTEFLDSATGATLAQVYRKLANRSRAELGQRMGETAT